MYMKKYIVASLSLFLLGCTLSQVQRNNVSTNSVDGFSQRIESMEQRIDADSSLLSFDGLPKKALLYDVCSIEFQKNNVLYPCDIGDSVAWNLLHELTTSDSLKQLNTSVLFFYYAAEVFRYQFEESEDGPRSGFYFDRTPIYVFDNGDKKALCASADGKRCSYLAAKMSVENRYYKRTTGEKRLRGTVDPYIDVLFPDSLNDVSKDSLIKAFYVNRFVPEKETSGFELCWQGDGTFNPCEIDSSTVFDIKHYADKDGFEVESMTYGMRQGDEAALLFSTAVDKPVCKTMSNGECRYVVVLAKKAANKKEGKVFFYDRETGKIVEYEDSVPSSSFADNYWPFHKPDGTWLPDYKWK